MPEKDCASIRGLVLHFYGQRVHGNGEDSITLRIDSDADNHCLDIGLFPYIVRMMRDMIIPDPR